MNLLLLLCATPGSALVEVLHQKKICVMLSLVQGCTDLNQYFFVTPSQFENEHQNRFGNMRAAPIKNL